MNRERNQEITIFLLSLLSLRGIGSRTVIEIIDRFGDAITKTERLDASFALSLGISKVEKALANSALSWNEIEKNGYNILETSKDLGARILNPFSPDYPTRLLMKSNYPPILYCQGDLNALSSEKAVAMVGTRKPTDFGARMGRRLAELFAADGYTIISGLALGCDSIAHEGALAVGGKTAAVLPTPIGAPIYPRQNQSLANRILDSGGALVSEYPPNMKLNDKQLMSNLVARDEWQSGLADGLIVFETKTDGGSRHAIEHALKTGVPVAVFDYSSRPAIDFKSDVRFGGNNKYLRSDGVSPIFEIQSIGIFKRKMSEYRETCAFEPPAKITTPSQTKLRLH